MPKHKIVETTIPACHHRDAALVTTRTCVPKWLHIGIAAVLRRARSPDSNSAEWTPADWQ
jgi:hypothetical protein